MRKASNAIKPKAYGSGEGGSALSFRFLFSFLVFFELFTMFWLVFIGIVLVFLCTTNKSAIRSIGYQAKL